MVTMEMSRSDFSQNQDLRCVVSFSGIAQWMVTGQDGLLCNHVDGPLYKMEAQGVSPTLKLSRLYQVSLVSLLWRIFLSGEE